MSYCETIYNKCNRDFQFNNINKIKSEQGRQFSDGDKIEYHHERNKMVSSDNFQISICKNDFKYVSLKQIFQNRAAIIIIKMPSIKLTWVLFNSSK